MKIQHYETFYLTYVPGELVERAKSIGFVESNRQGVIMELDVASNPRNVRGYRGAFDKDLASLRQGGAVVTGKLTREAEDALARGKQIDNRKEDEKVPVVDKTVDGKTHPKPQKPAPAPKEAT